MISSQSSSRRRLLGIFNDDLEVFAAEPLVLGDRSLNSQAKRDSEDVDADWTAELLTKGIFSKLAWADTFRNIGILNAIMVQEPGVVLEVGCGNHHPVGKLMAAYDANSHYVGMDIVKHRARWVATKEGGVGKREHVGVWWDAKHGIPLKSGTVGTVLCLEAMEHFCETVDDCFDFFKEVRRVLGSTGTFYLATPNPRGGPLVHPDCHDHEFEFEELVMGANREGLALMNAWNYRVKDDTTTDDQPNFLPQAFFKAAMYPSEHQWNRNKVLVRGNVLYTFKSIQRHGES